MIPEVSSSTTSALDVQVKKRFVAVTEILLWNSHVTERQSLAPFTSRYLLIRMGEEQVGRSHSLHLDLIHYTLISQRVKTSHLHVT